MSSDDAIVRQSQHLEIHLVGIGLGHALTPAVHNFVARSIDVPWRLIATECSTISDCVRIFRSPKQAGGVVTMPWKGEIMKYLDQLNETASTLRACNVVYFDESRRLCGSNTDWIGIEGALRAAGAEGTESKKAGVAAVIGAGGAARAVIYTLTVRFGIREIYVLNRDDDEVAQLVQDCKKMYCQLLHVKSVEQARGLQRPSHIVGAVPDFEPTTPEELAIKAVLDFFLAGEGEKGVMLDMCYHPTSQTRNLKLAEGHGWRTLQGSQVVGHQVEALWRFWVGEERLKRLDREGMWRTLRDAADMNSEGRQALNAEIIKQHFGSTK